MPAARCNIFGSARRQLPRCALPGGRCGSGRNGSRGDDKLKWMGMWYGCSLCADRCGCICWVSESIFLVVELDIHMGLRLEVLYDIILRYKHVSECDQQLPRSRTTCQPSGNIGMRRPIRAGCLLRPKRRPNGRWWHAPRSLQLPRS